MRLVPLVEFSATGGWLRVNHGLQLLKPLFEASKFASPRLSGENFCATPHYCPWARLSARMRLARWRNRLSRPFLAQSQPPN